MNLTLSMRYFWDDFSGTGGLTAPGLPCMKAEIFSRRLGFLLVFMALGGCTTSNSGPVAITKVNPYHLNEKTAASRSTDPMLEFRPERLLHGAVTAEERRDRFGFYFSIFWKTDTRDPATVRLDFRQGNTGSRVFTREETVSSPKRSNVTKFRVIGDEYEANGKVTQWKVSVIEAGKVVAEYKSFLWKE